ADGTIADVGDMAVLSLPMGEGIDCTGLTITPGLINADTDIGLIGHPVVEMTRDANETTERALPQLRALDGINPLDKAIPRVRAAGTTTVYISPGEANLISGQGAVIKLRRSPAVEDLVLQAPAGIHINLGEGPKSTWRGKGGPSTRMGTAAVIRQELTAAQNWIKNRDKRRREIEEYQDKVAKGEDKDKDGNPLKAPDPLDRDLKKEALALLLDRTVPAIFSVHRQDDILTALRIAQEFNLDAIILHGTAAWQVLPELQAAKVPVLVGPVRTDPSSMETLAARLDNAALLEEAGVPFAIQTGDALGARALAHEAAWAMAGGLPRREALLAITRYPAEILGLGDRIGSLEPGKEADLVLWTADPLAITAVARYVLIEGRLVNDSEQLPAFIDAPGW
ncbi:MAG TPA: amidohydrolase family protein, partial [bacterium]|nr:amidohydrolase family protein [bacterium]